MMAVKPLPVSKRDCFAYKLIEQESPLGKTFKAECTALNRLECRAEGGECPFYKSIIKWRGELERLNGTTDLDEILERYRRAHEANG